MPLTIPNLDNRRYQDLLDEALARIPVHTPEWTNFNKSDPGVTLIEVFAFLTESLLYRSNQIPERNRRKFLKLLNIPLQPATAAQGLITISNDKGALETVTLNDSLEARAGQVPFRTTRALDVLPIEARVYFKQALDSPTPEVLDYYQQLYASYRGTPQSPAPRLYQVTAFPLPGGAPVDLAQTLDGYLWLALLVRESDKPPALLADAAREAIANKTLSVGVVPNLAGGTAVLPAGRPSGATAPVTLQFDVPNLPASGGLVDSQGRVPQYRPLDCSPTADLFTQPGVVDVSLPGKDELRLWNNLSPLEAGVDQLPPALDDSAVNDRLITWLRIRPSAATQAQFLWMGINCAPVSQRDRISAELLPPGSGEPDQLVTLSHAPVLPGTVQLAVTTLEGATSTWTEIDDLFGAGPEVPVPDLRQPPGSPAPVPAPSKVFALNAEAGEIRFGDGAHGARPPENSLLRASYEFSAGSAGNVGPGSISTSPVLPQGFQISNPIRTWGGAAAETAVDGEKQITRYLQHRDRLVTVADFKTITLRTPGIGIGRVEVLPTYHPELSTGRGGDAPGAVTVMLIPSFDAANPNAPSPTQDFLDTVCNYLDPRRLVTTEVFLRGPVYRGIWISIGIRALPGVSFAPVREAVKTALYAFLAPNGWPLGKTLFSLELARVGGNVSGVEFVQGVLLAQDAAAQTQIDFTGLELPEVLGISVTDGDPLSLDELRGKTAPAKTGGSGFGVQVPVIPQECR